MSAIRPNKAQFMELAAAPDEGPVVMLNLLKFKERAGGAGDQGVTGAAEYAKYGDAVVQMVEGKGGKILWMARADQILIGDAAEPWDTVVLVQYPSRQAFLEMVSTPEYADAHEHRESGLERTVVIACTETTSRLP